MSVQASNRLFKLLYRTDRLEVYPYATGWLSYRTGWLSHGTGCSTRSVADCTTEIFVLVLSVSRTTAKFFLLQVHPRKSVFPRNVVRSVQIPLTTMGCALWTASLPSPVSTPIEVHASVASVGRWVACTSRTHRPHQSHLTDCVHVTNDGMFALVGLTALTNLNLTSCEQVSDAGLHALASLTAL
jgi:hypothetical protein